MKPSHRFTWRVRNALVLASASLVAGCVESGRFIGYDAAIPVESGARVVTLFDYFEGGRLAVNSYLDLLPAAERDAFAAARARVEPACTRVRIVAERSGWSEAIVSGSGVVIRRGGVLLPVAATAGHSLAEIERYDADVTIADGTELSTRVGSSSFEQFGSSSEDWALLEIDDPPAALPGAVVASPREGELVLVLGYANEMGMRSDGTVVYAAAYEGDALSPIVSVARVETIDPLRLAPVAGALPMGGASGGPIVNRDGAVVGLLVGVSWIPEREGTNYWIEAVSVESLRDGIGR